jgi:hypothetical protein
MDTKKFDLFAKEKQSKWTNLKEVHLFSNSLDKMVDVCKDISQNMNDYVAERNPLFLVNICA